MDDLFVGNIVKEFSVSEISKNIKKLMEDNFAYLKIKGEIVGLKQSNLGHIYFSLKEGNDTIAAVCFKTTANFINVELKDGLNVVVTGRITTYSGRSSYQIVVEGIKEDGVGNILKNLEALKLKLLGEGLFDLERKKLIPKFPEKVGIITSEYGAAIEDIMSRLKDRLATKVFLYPALVQGENSPKDIIDGIHYFNNLPELKKPDVIVITRGGGSFEDLIYFNDEALVRAVGDSEIPIISAVGHEVDTNLIDFVADLSLPTPTAVGETLFPLKSELLQSLQSIQFYLHDTIKNLLRQKVVDLKYLQTQLKSPIETINRKQILLDHKLKQLNIYFEHKLTLLRILNNGRFNEIKNLLFRLGSSVNNLLNFSYKNISSYDKLLNSYNPKFVLNKGYALVSTINQKLIQSVKDVSEGDILTVKFKDGDITVLVKKS